MVEQQLKNQGSEVAGYKRALRHLKRELADAENLLNQARRGRDHARYRREKMRDQRDKALKERNDLKHEVRRVYWILTSDRPQDAASLKNTLVHVEHIVAAALGYPDPDNTPETQERGE